MPGRTHSITIPARGDALRVVRGYCRPLLEDLFPAEEANRVLVAIDECCSNVVRHRCDSLGAYVTVELTVDGDTLRVRFGNFCRAEDVPAIRPRDLDDVRPGGLGTHFVRLVMDEIGFEADDEHPEVRHLVAVKRLPSPGGDDDGPSLRDADPR